MGRILVTGSADRLGLKAARRLVQRGHTVYLHARNEKRALDTKSACPGAAGVLTADLSNLAKTLQLAKEANAIGNFNAIIHNAGMLDGPFRKTPDTGIASVNVLAPYVLSCLMRPPKRIVYIASCWDTESSFRLVEDVFRFRRGEAGFRDFPAYCDSKFHVMLLANAVARRFKNTTVSSVHPGWVATKPGGQGAPDSLEDGVATYVMLAEGCDAPNQPGRYFDPKKKVGTPLPATADVQLQEKLVKACEDVTGLTLPI
ncbi:NAD(P)-binding protein [Aspergillus sclerotioniger CBS 115572]|uniref:NAD(P)-binding protein n=1 Tax=Aspergillus sclerotioniger CBS 115572 TaxID=1450535 RepID=A0A317XC98_9EURO|nr:NAD(P)-binding protein [Aspergillus sclerotioniger CBS 115572]PWY95731.1 NAD(P)-binding protein [Aspergillus sclerotioniger CBS 115572]